MSKAEPFSRPNVARDHPAVAAPKKEEQDIEGEPGFLLPDELPGSSGKGGASSGADAAAGAAVTKAAMIRLPHDARPRFEPIDQSD